MYSLTAREALAFEMDQLNNRMASKLDKIKAKKKGRYVLGLMAHIQLMHVSTHVYGVWLFVVCYPGDGKLQCRGSSG